MVNAPAGGQAGAARCFHRAKCFGLAVGLCRGQVGLTWYAPPSAPPPQGPALAEIYDAELETLAREAYAADYTNFGFKPLEI